VQVVAGQQQQVMNPDPTLEADIVAMAEDARRFVAAVLQVRGGKLLERKAFDLPKTDGAQQHEALAAFVVQYYAALPDNDIPGQIVLPHPQSDGLLWQRWLAKRRGTPVSVLSCGLAQPLEALAGTDPAHWMQTVGRLAQKNAQEFLEQAQLAEANRARFDPMAALEELQEALDLPDFPRRMECYDISHVQGSHTVASMVVFTEGVPDKAAYRRFKIRCVDGKPDDFASMAEVIARRFAHLGHDGQTGEDGWDAPDLVIIDGGKGQLGAALGALRQAGLDDQPIISLAKRYEEVYLPGRTRPVLLPRHSRALFLLQQIRDEAHRFAITFHRSIRGKSATRSALDNVPGLGDVRKQKLLEKYPSLAAVAEAPPEEVAQFIRWSVVRVQQMQRLLKQGAEA
jgi:excinuclease ABC subunit C